MAVRTAPDAVTDDMFVLNKRPGLPGLKGPSGIYTVTCSLRTPADIRITVIFIVCGMKMSVDHLKTGPA
jgi:hypothetical protein